MGLLDFFPLEAKSESIVNLHLLRLIGPHQLTNDEEGREGWPSENMQTTSSFCFWTHMFGILILMMI